MKAGKPHSLIRYLLKDFLGHLGLAFFGLVLILTLGNVFDEFNRVLRYEPPIWAMMVYFGLKVPYHMVASVPLAVLIATLFTLARMLKSHELVAMRSGGMSQYAIASPFLAASLVLSFLTIAFDETVLPWANNMRNEIKQVYIRKQPLKENRVVLRAALWTAKGQLIYAQEANGEEGVLKNVSIFEFAGLKPVIRADAASAVPVRESWGLSGAQIYRWKGGEVRLARASKSVYPVSEEMKDFLQEVKPVEALSLSDLKQSIERLKKAGKEYGSEQVFYYFKWAYPFASFIVALLGVGISFTFQSNPREGVTASFGVALFATLFYIGLVQLGEALGVGGVMPPLIAVWMANVVFLAAGLVLLWKAWRW